MLKLRDISIIIKKEDEDLEMLINDLERGIDRLIRAYDEDNNNPYVVFRGYYNDEEVDYILTFMKMSPYGTAYEVEEWTTGDCEILWNELN